jgi:hypothetical protein
MTSKLKTDVLETVSGSGTIALTNQLSGMTDASMPSGSVVQVVQLYVANSGIVSTTSTSLVASGIIATITPKYIGSTIIVNWISSMGISNDAGYAKMYIYDGAWAAMAGSANYHIGYNQTGLNNYAPSAFSGNVITTDLDALSFQPYMRVAGGTYSFIHGLSSYALTLTEIKG